MLIDSDVVWLIALGIWVPFRILAIILRRKKILVVVSLSLFLIGCEGNIESKPEEGSPKNIYQYLSTL